MLQAFNNVSYDAAIRTSEYFAITSTADIRVVYSTKSREVEPNGGTVALWFLTLGVIPYQRKSESDVTFKDVSKRTGALLGTYEYKVKHASWFGWLSVPISLFVVPVADKISELTTAEGLDLNVRILNRFAKDYATERRRKSGPQRPIRIFAGSAFLAIRGVETNPKHSEQNKMLRTLIELSLVNGGYKVVDRNNIKDILHELALSRTGLTAATRLKIGKLTGATRLATSTILYYNYDKQTDIYKVTYVVHITDVHTGEVQWKNLYTISGKNIDGMFAKGSGQFLKDLRFAGFR